MAISEFESIARAGEQPLSIVILGLRGFPNVQGGVESHVENLAPLLAERGCSVEVIVRSPYMPRQRPKEWRGVRFCYLWCPKTKSLEAIVHTFLGILVASLKRPDILHIHAVGPSVLVPLARLLGMSVVVTHHGPDYVREKWGMFARTILRLGEYAGMRFSNARIAISRTIQTLIHEKFDRESILIPNGAPAQRLTAPGTTLERFALRPRRFILIVGRLVPEKRHMDLIQAFQAANLDGWRLVIVGASDHPDEYARKVLSAIDQTPGVVATGFQTGEALREIYSNAGMFVLPSSHEGLPIALLEALSYGLPSIASRIPANLEVGLPPDHYFPVGDVGALSASIRARVDEGFSDREAGDQREWVSRQYNWPDIASRTIDVYRETIIRGSPS
jgi:glycosyltransferase involved in cell wall biosynthesis